MMNEDSYFFLDEKCMDLPSYCHVRYSDNGYIYTDNAGTWIQILEVHRMGFVG